MEAVRIQFLGIVPDIPVSMLFWRTSHNALCAYSGGQMHQTQNKILGVDKQIISSWASEICKRSAGCGLGFGRVTRRSRGSRPKGEHHICAAGKPGPRCWAGRKTA